MSKFSPFRFGQNRSTPLAAQLKYIARGVVAMGLAAFLFLAPLSFLVSAQESDSPKSRSDRDHFIFYQNAAGEVVCRDATLEEQREMDGINPQGLQQINHLPTESKFTDKAPTPDNDLPAHLTIILRATTQLEGNQPAKAAFIRAAQAWENQIKSPITIYLDADLGTTFFGEPWDEPGVLGATSSPSLNGVIYENVRRRLIAGYSNDNELAAYNLLPQISFPIDVSPGSANTMSVSSSIARAIGLLQPTADSTNVAARIGFNASHVFDFDRSNGISGYDFESIATHEIGHALGFTSRSGGTTNTVPAVWDLFRFRTGTTAATFPSATRIMTKGPTTGPDQFYFFPIGDSELGLSTGGPNPPPSGQPDGDGNQSSHWKESLLNGGTVIGIMDPRIPQGVRRDITLNDLRALNSFGYNLENSNPPPAPPPMPPVPANNDFVNAQILSTTACAGSVGGTNVRASKETGEPLHSPDLVPGGPSVWYQWTAPASGSVTITTDGSDYDTLLAIYTGNSVGGLTLIANNDDVQSGVVSSFVTFNANAGTVYKIAVDGWGGDTGNIVLNWNQGCPASTARFSTSSYQVAENAGSLQVVVNRIGTSAPATVTYATRDSAGLNNCNVYFGDASERCDYQTTVGTLRFAAGEATKTFTIPMIDDAHNEGPETFTVSLRSSIGAVVSSPATATATIVDDGGPAQNPFDSTQFFVGMQYIDFLGRLPDPSGLAGWTDVLNGCPNNGFGNDNPTCDRVHVSSGFFLSDEFRGRGYWAYRFYEVAFNRRPAYAEFVPDMAQVGGPQSPQSEALSKDAYKDEFVQRGEFTSQYNHLSNAAFVDAIEANAEVNLDNAGLTAQLNGGKSRAQLLREIVESKAVEDQFFIRAFVAMQYFGYLRRDPDTDGYNGWVTTLNANPSDFRHMIFGFIYSNEYRTRFGL
jgi:hypothetical protein